MPELLTVEAVAAQLQISKEQVVELAKKGMLRGFLDQKVYKFRPSDVESYKKKVESGQTSMSGEEAPSTSRIDLDSIEAEAGADESDQTSVLKPAADNEPKTAPAEPVFQFSEEELGLKEEPAAAQDEADQTSLLGPVEDAEADVKPKTSPALDFSEKELDLTAEEEGEAPISADESESSVDILEVSDESSSESASTTASALFAEESSGDEIPAGAPPAGKRGDKTVTDILSTEESDEDLAGLDLEEVVETRGTKMEGEESGSAEEEVDSAQMPLAEHGVPDSEAAAEPVEEAQPTTAGVNEAIAEAVEEQIELPEAEAEEGEQVVVPSGWEVVRPSPLINVALIAAMLFLIIGGVFVVCNMMDIMPRWSKPIVTMISKH